MELLIGARLSLLRSPEMSQCVSAPRREPTCCTMEVRPAAEANNDEIMCLMATMVSEVVGYREEVVTES